MAVRVTDKAAFPFDKWVMKLDTFPPGQAATKIIPRANPGAGLRANTSKTVSAGRKRN